MQNEAANDNFSLCLPNSIESLKKIHIWRKTVDFKPLYCVLDFRF